MSIEDDPEAARCVLGIGAVFFAYAALLYWLTSAKERPGFRFIPAGGREWAHYKIRTLMLLILASAPSAFGSGFDPPFLIFLVVILLVFTVELRSARLDVWSIGCVLLLAFVALRVMFPEIAH